MIDTCLSFIRREVLSMSRVQSETGICEESNFAIETPMAPAPTIHIWYGKGVSILLFILMIGGFCRVSGENKSFTLTPVSSAQFTHPVDVVVTSDHSGRLFVVEQKGTIRT